MGGRTWLAAAPLLTSFYRAAVLPWAMPVYPRPGWGVVFGWMSQRAFVVRSGDSAPVRKATSDGLSAMERCPVTVWLALARMRSVCSGLVNHTSQGHGRWGEIQAGSEGCESDLWQRRAESAVPLRLGQGCHRLG